MRYERIGVKNALKASTYALRIWKDKIVFKNKNRFFRPNHSFWLAYERGFRYSLKVLFSQFQKEKTFSKNNNGFSIYKNFDELLKDFVKKSGNVLNRAKIETKHYALLISHELSYTGAPIALLHMARALRELGVTPVILSPKSGVLSKETKRYDITTLVYENLYKDNFIISFAAFFDFVEINTLVCSRIVHKFNYTNIPIMWWIHEAKESYIYDEHNMPIHLSSNIKVYACGDYASKLVKQHRPSYDVKEFLYYIPTYNKFPKIGSTIENKIKNKKVFVCTGALTKRKNQLLLIDSIPRLKKNIIKKSIFVFVGNNYDHFTYDKLSKLIKKYPNNVLYTGELSPSKISALYKKMDALICPSSDDPMPMVVAEALSLNKLVICSNNTGSASLINRHKGGIVFQSGNMKQLVSCIENAFNGLYDFSSPNAAIGVYEKYYCKSIFLRNLSNVYFSLAKSSQNSVKRFINFLPPEYLNQIDLNQMFRYDKKESVLLINPSRQRVIDKCAQFAKKYNILIALTDNFDCAFRNDFPIIHLNKPSDIKPHSLNLFKKVIIDKVPRNSYFDILKCTYNLSFVDKKSAKNLLFETIHPNSVSVVIPTYNPNSLLFESIKMLNKQKYINGLEIIIIDSGSDKKIIKKIKSLENIKLFSIPHEKFSHSFSRNYGASKAQYANVVMMTQDAVPIGRKWLYNLIKPLVKNRAVASTCYEICPPGTDPYYRAISDYHIHFMNFKKNKIRAYEYGKLRKSSNLTDVTCAVKKEILENYPYRLNYAEDFDLGIRLVLDQYNLAFLKSAKTMHGHNRDANYYLRRGIIESVELNKLFDNEFKELNNQYLKWYLNFIVNNYSLIVCWLSKILKDKNINDSETFMLYSKLSFDKLAAGPIIYFSNKIYSFEDYSFHNIVSDFTKNVFFDAAFDKDYSLAFNVRSYFYENVLKFINYSPSKFPKSLAVEALYKTITINIGNILGNLSYYPLVKKVIKKHLTINV